MEFSTINRNKAFHQRGSGTLEFAFALILILFPLMLGIIDFSRALYAYHWVAYAAREGTRWASVRGAACTSPMTSCNATAAQIQSYVQSIVAPGIFSASCSGSNAGCISINTTSSYVWPGTGGAGRAAQTAAAPRPTVRVAPYACRSIIFLGSLFRSC